MKIRLDAECVAAITCARLDPSDQRTPPILADRLDIPKDELADCVRGTIYYLHNLSALFDAYATSAWVWVIS